MDINLSHAVMCRRVRISSECLVGLAKSQHSFFFFLHLWALAVAYRFRIDLRMYTVGWSHLHWRQWLSMYRNIFSFIFCEFAVLKALQESTTLPGFDIAINCQDSHGSLLGGFPPVCLPVPPEFIWYPHAPLAAHDKFHHTLLQYYKLHKLGWQWG